MPEGDTIWRAARALRGGLVGERVVSARPAQLARLAGRRLAAVDPVGKHLYMSFEGGLVLHSHMRMTGAWHLYRDGEPWRRAAHRATAVIDFPGVQAVLFAAPVCELVAADAVGTGLGPDILGPALDIDGVVAMARRSPLPSIAEVLLDQSVCAGIGNIHRCNALWHERIDPLIAVAAIDDATVARVYLRARDQLRRGAVGDGFRPRGGVHGRSGRPCSACGAVIRAAPLGRPSRILYWCPGCQALGAPTVAAGGSITLRAAPTG